MSIAMIKRSNTSRPWLAGVFTQHAVPDCLPELGHHMAGDQDCGRNGPAADRGRPAFLIAFPLFLSFRPAAPGTAVVPEAKPLVFRVRHAVVFQLAVLPAPIRRTACLVWANSAGCSAACRCSSCCSRRSSCGKKSTLSQMLGIAIGFGSLFMIIRSQGLHLDHAELLGVLAILCAR